MAISLSLNANQIHTLDLAPAIAIIEPLVQERTIVAREQQLRFAIDYPREADDPRELSEIPEVRLWFIRLDAKYPWLPFLLDWKFGELARYAAMLIPHQFHPKEGIQYNPEALEMFVMHKTFVLADWLKSYDIAGKSRLKAMAQVLGYDLEDPFFELLET